MPVYLRICICLLACLLTSVAPHHQITTQPHFPDTPYSPQTRTNDRALFFAVNTYDHLDNLTKPIQNARDIAAELEETYGFETELFENPSIDKIDQTIETYRQRYADGTYKASGQLLIYFSGHGIKTPSNGYFMAKDSDPKRPNRNGMEYDWYRDKIDQLNCQHILVAIDACHSATFDPDFAFRRDRSFQRKGEEQFDRILANHDSYKARVFWTSDAVGKQTPDKSNFAYQFLEGLRSHSSPTGYLRSSELFSIYLEKVAPKPGGGRFGTDEPSSAFLFFQETPDYSSLEADVDAWERAERLNTPTSYRAYLRSHPNGDFASVAHQRIRTQEAEAAKQVDYRLPRLASGQSQP